MTRFILSASLLQFLFVPQSQYGHGGGAVYLPNAPIQVSPYLTQPAMPQYIPQPMPQIYQPHRIPSPCLPGTYVQC